MAGWPEEGKPIPYLPVRTAETGTWRGPPALKWVIDVPGLSTTVWWHRSRRGGTRARPKSLW